MLTVSEFAARDIAAVLGVARGAHPRRGRGAGGRLSARAIRRATSRRPPRASGCPSGATWFTYVGGFNPHKHVDAIVRAHAERSCAALAERDRRTCARRATLTSDVFHRRARRIRDARSSAAGTDDTGALARLCARRGAAPPASAARSRWCCRRECEGFGLPAVEAAACGTPVIATTESPLPELLEGGGIFVAPGDEAALVAAMRSCCATADATARVGRAARRGRARDALSWAPQRARSARRPATRRPRERRCASACSRRSTRRTTSAATASASSASRARSSGAGIRSRWSTTPTRSTRCGTRRRARRRSRRRRGRRGRSRSGAARHALAAAHAAARPPGRQRPPDPRHARATAASTSSTSTTSRSIGGPGCSRYGGDAVKLYMAHEHWLVCPTHVLWRHGRELCTGRECLRCTLRYQRPPQLWRYTGLPRARSSRTSTRSSR